MRIVRIFLIILFYYILILYAILHYILYYTIYQGGHGHINVKTNTEVVELMSHYGYIQNEWTGMFQTEGRLNAIYTWFAGSFLVFINSDTIKK